MRYGKIDRMKAYLEKKRMTFWAWMFTHHHKLFRWCDKHLPFNTLPF